MKTDIFQSCGHCWVFQICWHIECSTFTESCFRMWNSCTGIPSPPLALFVVMLPKAHLTSHSRMSGSSVHTIVIIWVMKIFFVQFLCRTPWNISGSSFSCSSDIKFSKYQSWIWANTVFLWWPCVSLRLKALASGYCLPVKRFEKESKEANHPHTATMLNLYWTLYHPDRSPSRICEK